MNWVNTTLGEISVNIQTGPFGSQLHQSDYAEAGIPVVMPKDLINGHIDDNTIARVQEEHVERLRKHKIRKGDILYPRRGDIGKCAFSTDKEEGWLCGTGCLRVTIDETIANPKFVFYQLFTNETKGWIEKHAIGATMLNLNTSILERVPIVLPEMIIQNSIANILSNYDTLIENNQKQIKLLEEAAQRLYKEWFVDLHFPGHEQTRIVDGVPEGWRNAKLGDLAFYSGKPVSKELRNNYNCYLPIDSLPRKSITYLNSESVELAESSLVSFEKNDVLFGSMRPYFHKVVTARDKGLTRTTCFVLNAKNDIMWSYLLMLLFSSSTINYATTISVGTTMPYVRWNDFALMPLLIPKSSVAESFNQIIKPIISKINILSKQIVYLTEARDRLLPKLMSGEIEVQ